MPNYYVIGAGLWGCTMAERIASVMNLPVTIIDKRQHTGGNCYSSINKETGIECHHYGSHIFHTSIPKVWKYITQFGHFNAYRHKVLTTHFGKVYAMPISLLTINTFYGKNLAPREAEAFLLHEIQRDRIANPANLEEHAISLIGRPLYEAFIKNYTHKQWGREPRDLPANIITRLPFRTSYNLDYFNDTWQGVPADGYFALIKNMLSHPNIKLRLNCDFAELRSEIPSDATVIYTGMPDELFDYKYGELEWRSLNFEWETVEVRDFQGTAVMNYADLDVDYTRIHEFKHYHPEREIPLNSKKTIICREFPAPYRKGNEAYYPINNERNNHLYAQYAAEAEQVPGLVLGGRLGAYRYWDMDKAIENALDVFHENVFCLDTHH
jgi:UDP-galactopyranose mutase